MIEVVRSIIGSLVIELGEALLPAGERRVNQHPALWGNDRIDASIRPD